MPPMLFRRLRSDEIKWGTGLLGGNKGNFYAYAKCFYLRDARPFSRSWLGDPKCL